MSYVSEFTQFMNGWLEKHPEELQERKQGRELWWDKPQDTEASKVLKSIKVAQKPYPYQAE